MTMVPHVVTSVSPGRTVVQTVYAAEPTHARKTAWVLHGLRPSREDILEYVRAVREANESDE